MQSNILSAVYIAGLLVAEALRFPYRVHRTRPSAGWARPARQRSAEALVMVAILAGIWILPGLYIFTSWLSHLDYTLPPWMTWPAIAIFVTSLVLRWRAHKDLGSLWSHTVELSHTHHLVTTGIYGQVRHPLYASLVLWAIAQPVLLQNVLAGWGGPFAVALIWLIRVPAEESMMRERFGAEYAEYARRTGRIIPKAKKQAA